MRKPRPNMYNPAQALTLILSDRSGDPLSCPVCGTDDFEREPDIVPPRPRSQVTLRCAKCHRIAKYVAGAA